MSLQIQEFIVSLLKTISQLQKVDKTFIGVALGQINSQDSPSYVKKKNQYFWRKLTLAVEGNYDAYNPESYQKSRVKIMDTQVYVKEFWRNGQRIRMVFVPAAVSSKDKEQSSMQMVKRFFLINNFMKARLTRSIMPIVLQFIPKYEQGSKGKQCIGEQMRKIYKHYRENQSLLCQQKQLYFCLCFQAKEENLSFSSQLDKSDKSQESANWLITTNDDKVRFLAKEKGRSIKVDSKPLVLSQSGKMNVVKDNDHPLFTFNKLTEQKSRKWIDMKKNVAEELCSVIDKIVQPISRVKEHINEMNSYKVKKIEKFKEEKLVETTMKGNWNQFNQIFEFKEWKKTVAVIKKQVKIEQNCQQMMQIDEKNEINLLIPPQDTLLQKYSKQFHIYEYFHQQSQSFISAMIIDHIQRIGKEMRIVYNQMRMATDIGKQMNLERKVLEFSKIIVRLLSQFKDLPQFMPMLTDYEGEFYQYLLEVYCGMYSDFCFANKQVFGKLLGLSQRIYEQKPPKQLIINLISSVDGFISKQNKYGQNAIQEQLLIKRLFLQTLNRLLQENKPEQISKKIQYKIIETKYELGSICYQYGLLQQGSNQLKELKNALRMLFQSYKLLFLQKKHPPTGHLRITETRLLKKISGVLKMLSNIDLSIQIEKKLGNILAVQHYYNIWMLNYRANTEEGCKRLSEICNKAIEYFTLKLQHDKVKHYYNILIKNAFQEKVRKQQEIKRFSYIQKLEDPAQKKKANNNAEKATFSLTPDTVKKIEQVYTDVKSQQKMIN